MYITINSSNRHAKKEVKSFTEYFKIIDDLAYADHEIILYRGQNDLHPLLPSIARKDPKVDTTENEMEMLAELKRRSQLIKKAAFESDWDWLVYAQHFGMKTRLLDWSSNPLTALWFACCNEYSLDKDSYVYIFVADDSFLIDTKKNESPFSIKKTRILRPALNNERIIAQAGWFTAHLYSSKRNRFIKAETNSDFKQQIIEVKVLSSMKKEALARLSIFGIHAQTLFPDISGVCSHLNWMYTTNI